MYTTKQQKKSISRQIDTSKVNQRIRIDNGRIIQCHMGSRQGDSNFVCSCDSEITYKTNGRNGSVKKSTGSGGNDGNTRSVVLSIFKNHGLVSLFAIPQQDNEPGQCAEPHAVADALNKIPEMTKVLSIQVSQATNKFGNLKKRCGTCKQWVPGDKVKQQYIVQEF